MAIPLALIEDLMAGTVRRLMAGVLGRSEAATVSLADVAAGRLTKWSSQATLPLSRAAEDSSANLIDKFSAAAGSKWEMRDGTLNLFSGSFELGGKLKARIFSGTAVVRDQASIVSQNSAMVLPFDSSIVSASGDSVVRISKDAGFFGKVIINDRARLVDNYSKFQGLFTDARERINPIDQQWIRTSTNEFPFVNAQLLHANDSLIAKRYGQIKDSLFLIRKEGADGRYSSGNGFWLGDRKIATVGHVFEGFEGDITVTSPSGKVYPATLQSFDAKKDLASLELAKAIKEPLNIAKLAESSALSAGSEIMQVGIPPRMKFPHVYPGEIISSNKPLAEIFDKASLEKFHHDTDINNPCVFSNAFGHPGTSGSPLIDLSSGEVIGVTQGGIPMKAPVNKFSGDSPWFGMAIRTEDLTAHLRG